MIIWIDMPVEAVDDISGSTLEAVLELGEAGYRGRHAVVGSRSLLLRLSDFQDLSLRAKTYFRRVSEEYTQLRFILGRPRKITASLDVVAPVKRGEEWAVPLSLFSQSRYSDPAHVVCENDVDYDIYRIFAEIMVRQELPGSTLCSLSYPGGGGSVATVLPRILNEPNPFVLCLLDSDRNVIYGGEGGTARGGRNVWRESWRSRLMVLTCRELENALPLDTVRHCINGAGEDATSISHFELLDKCLLDYMCLKSGEKLCRFREISPDARGYRPTMRALTEAANRWNGFACCDGDSADCGCYVSPALGEYFLRRFLVWLQDYGNRRLIPNFERWTQDLQMAASLFVDFSLALPRRQ